MAIGNALFTLKKERERDIKGYQRLKIIYGYRYYLRRYGIQT